MNDLQIIEFDLLKHLINVCEKHNLRYYLVCGSALGAVKYKGFIPWDDDIDVALPRQDYNLLLQYAEKEFPSYIFLQNCYSDPMFPLVSSKLRNVQTTYIEKGYQHLDIVHGVYIDIFPLDSYPIEADAQKRYLRSIRKYERRKSLNMVCGEKRHGIRTIIVSIITPKSHGRYKTDKYIRQYNEYLSEMTNENAEFLCNHHEERSPDQYILKKWYGEGKAEIFEGIGVVVPEQAEEYLSKRYGNWRDDLPDDQKVGHHYYEVCDFNRPYTDYIEKLPCGKIRIKKTDELN